MTGTPKTLEEFLAVFDPDGSRTVLDYTLARPQPGTRRDDSPLVIVRHGRHAAIITLMPEDGHLCIDVHPFTDGELAVAGVFGSTPGRQHNLTPTGLTSWGRPAADLVSVLVGDPSAPVSSPQERALTERRKADRAMMAGTVAELARQHDLDAVVLGEQHGSRMTAVDVAGPHGLKLTVRFRGRSPQTSPDTYVLSWHGADEGWRLNPGAFSDVNPHHGCKATDVVHGFGPLVQALTRRFADIQAGHAFIAPEGTE